MGSTSYEQILMRPLYGSHLEALAHMHRVQLLCGKDAGLSANPALRTEPGAAYYARTPSTQRY